jgi:hypothetical protein
MCQKNPLVEYREAEYRDQKLLEIFLFKVTTGLDTSHDEHAGLLDQRIALETCWVPASRVFHYPSGVISSSVLEAVVSLANAASIIFWMRGAMLDGSGCRPSTSSALS